MPSLCKPNSYDWSVHVGQGLLSLLYCVVKVNREYVLEVFLQKYPCLREVREHTFEPYGQDTVTAISRDHGAEIFLDKDARKWANKLTKDQMTITSLEKQVKGLLSVKSAYIKVVVDIIVLYTM